MQLLGRALLALGIIIAIYAMNMDVTVTVAGQNIGYGIRTPEVTVVNQELLSKRQNTLIIGGILALVGAIFTGFGTLLDSKRGSLEVKEALTESKIEQTPHDRVQFCDGKYSVGQRRFDTFAEAETFLSKSPTA